VKILSWWGMTQKKVQIYIFSIDASEGTSEGCAEAIKHSMKKLDDMIALLLKGQTTDSGGGGVLESLGNKLQKRDLCKPTYLVASCTLHAIQIALANLVKQSLGEGALGARTIMQMLHSAYDLQESMEYSKFQLITEEAQPWVYQKRNDCFLPPDRYDQKIKEFLINKWDRLHEFALPHEDEEQPPERMQRIPQPVLTRWWYVGVAVAFLKQYYCIVLRATQICININDSKSCPNKIASGLRSLMKQDVTYSDMFFLAQFHTDFLTEHFKWLQEEDEVANKPGFRCRQILVRYYLMHEDLEKLKTRIDRNAFGDYATNLRNLSEEKKLKQKRKSEAFLDEAITSLDNHYLRWCNELISAALGGEAPLANVVVRILLKHHLWDTPSSQIDAKYFSTDHKWHLDLLDFASFVRKNYTREVEMDETTKRLAHVIATGRFDIRMNDEQILTQNDTVAAKLRHHFCNCYLPLASNSQFVEAGVKEAKIVSTTGRNEELRSVYAICLSFLFGKLNQTKNTPARVFQILTVVIKQNAIHENEIAKPERTERRKIVTIALLENH
jgi:hypothetical protein